MPRPRWITFGVAQQNTPNSASSPQVDGAVAATVSSADSKEFGLENFGNTCYANSVLQTLYFCNPFRELLLQLPDPSVPQEPLTLAPPPLPPPPPTASPQLSATVRPRKPERRSSIIDGRAASETGVAHMSMAPPIPLSPPTLSSALRSLFVHISKNPADKGTVAPRAFIEKLRQLNELFRSQMHQDAHEFLNYLLNRVVEEIEQERRQGGDSDLSTSLSSLPVSGPATATLVHRLFEGVLTSETRCLTCETVSSRDESFIDLSIDIEQNSSVTACLRQFSASEMLCQKNKFFCDSCCDLQEAEKRMKIKKLPNVLALHLKRFKYQEELQKYIKLTYRVAFPMELKLFNTVDDADDPDRLYELFGIVVHIGNGPHHGHYVSIIKANGSWKIFDDDTVDSIKESDIPKYFGDSNSGSAYVLYYQAVDIDLQALGLRPPTPPPQPVVESLSDDLPIPALPPGLVSEMDLSDVAESSGPTTPAASNPAYSPKIRGSPVPIKLNILPSDLSPPMSTLNTPTSPQKTGGGLFHSLRHTPSVRIRSTMGTSDNRRSLLDAASMVASTSSSSSTAPPSNSNSSTSSKPTARPGTAPAASLMPPVTEPPSLPPSPKTKDVNGKERWFKRKSPKVEKDKLRDKDRDTLTSSFASDRSKGKDDQDSSNWLKAPRSSQKYAGPTKTSDSLAPPSPVSSIGSASQRSASPSPPSLSPQLTSHLVVDQPPFGKLKTLLRPRPSTAEARIAGPPSPSVSVMPRPPEEAPPLPPLPAFAANHRSSNSVVSPPKRRAIDIPGDVSPVNESAHRKRPSSAHASVGAGGLGMNKQLSSTPMGEDTLKQLAGQSSGSTQQVVHGSGGGSSGSNWKRATRKLSLTGNILGFGKKHRDRLESVTFVNGPPSSFPATPTSKH